MKRLLICGIACILSVCLLSGGHEGPGRSKDVTVYYQVVYEDGTIRDLPAVPEASEGIKYVTRVSHIGAGTKASVVYTTDEGGVVYETGGRTFRHDLRWNGRAWVAQAAEEGGRSSRRPSSRPANVSTAPATQPASAPASGPAFLGQIEQGKARSPAEGAYGIISPTDKRQVPCHRVQAWRLPPGRGRRSYQVSAAHPEAGRFGAFHYVAYADIDGDGTPDELIAISPLAESQEPGDWTSWDFTTSESDVYVGTAWPQEDTTIYFHSPAEGEANWRGLSREVYVGDIFDAAPTTRWAPYMTNIRVFVRDGGLDSPSPAAGSKIIVR